MTDKEQWTQQVFDFGARLQKEFPNLPFYKAGRELMKVAHSLAGLHLAACNYGLTDRQEHRHDRLEARAVELAASLNTTVVTNGDPRGYALYLVLPSGDCGGDWGQRGWPVPEA